MKDEAHKITYADDDTESTQLLLRLRVPPLLLGLFLGLLISFATSRFEEVLSQDVRVAFFLPFIVYMAAAVGTQTESIFLRDLRTGRAKFHNYLVKETLIGFILGVLFGGISFLIVSTWMNEYLLALSVGASMFAAVFSAPLVGLVVTWAVAGFREDPAVGAGPLATVLQDTISIVIYGVIASAILL